MEWAFQVARLLEVRVQGASLRQCIIEDDFRDAVGLDASCVSCAARVEFDRRRHPPVDAL